MRASLLSALFTLCAYSGAAHAMSCMIHETENKALLCYHTSADGRCLHFGPACETKATDQPAAKQIEPQNDPITTSQVAQNVKQ